MKEIGERLKETRESIGVSVEEAAEDLKMHANQIEAIEAGDMEVFKDVLSLKMLIRDYSKYLGLDYEEMIDEFNEYLFDYTSKISIEDIKKARKVQKEEKVERIASPYTVEKKRKILIPTPMIILFIFILGIVLFLFYRSTRENVPKEEDSVVLSSVGGNYELT